ncbi:MULTISPECIES: OsmC family protein [unclassified Auritidibacter]|uniref:OsmC family protein n=1 Tax=unclassified Auritidibacter TaxID=2634694 RepID=UPI0013140896|nr:MULTISPECIES: OsmC family protein [unclassified Auritidibacter]
MTTFTEQPQVAESESNRVSGVFYGSAQTTVSTGAYRFLVDEPEASGGKNAAPNPMEYILGATNGCISVVIEAKSGTHQIPIQGIHTYSYASQDLGGLVAGRDVQPHFHTYHLAVLVQTDVRDADRLRAFAQDVEHACPAANLLRAAQGLQLTVHWQFVDRLVDHDAEAVVNQALGVPNRNEPVDAAEPFLTLTNPDA